MGLFDTLKKAAKAAGEIADAVQKAENAAQKAGLTGTAPVPQPKPAAPQKTAAVPHPAPAKPAVQAAFPADASTSGSTERRLESWHRDSGHPNRTWEYVFRCHPDFRARDVDDTEFALVYAPGTEDLPDCGADDSEVNSPYIMLTCVNKLCDWLEHYQKTGENKFDRLEVLDSSVFPFRSECRMWNGTAYVYHLSAEAAVWDARPIYQLILFCPDGTDSGLVTLGKQALNEIAATFRFV